MNAVLEYRTNNPSCVYCKYAQPIDFFGAQCIAKQEHLGSSQKKFRRLARACKLYVPTTADLPSSGNAKGDRLRMSEELGRNAGRVHEKSFPHAFNPNAPNTYDLHLFDDKDG